MDALEGIIIGAAASAIGAVIAYKLINPAPVGGGKPVDFNAGKSAEVGGKTLIVYDDPGFSAEQYGIVQQTSPNTEAAYNQRDIAFESAFGPNCNQPSEEAVVTD